MVFLASAVILIIIAALGVFAPIIWEEDPTQQNLSVRYNPPSSEHLMGTDQLGRDVFLRVIYGARVSLGIAIFAATLSASIGAFIGFSAGFVGGWFDTVVIRMTDMLMAFPTVLLAIILITLLGGGVINLLFAISIASLPSFIRIARSAALSIRNTDYARASYSFGATMLWQVRKHVIPNGFPLIIVVATARMGTIILAEASLSFLGLGVPPGTPSWGAMISDGRRVLTEAPWVSLAPGIAIMLVVLSFNQLGDGLRDILDPSMRGSGINS